MPLQRQSLTKRSISKQVYAVKYRFLYELVQNADDSFVKRKIRANGSPYLRFNIRPDALIVETNELGFTRSNIEAICATGKSSKKVLGDDNHIGEKGFGFKSVFAIAEEVQIQSGLWAFCFNHSKGEDGLGMVTPLDASSEILPSDVTTRLTLRYSEEAKQDYSRLVDAAKELPDTMIMFLQELRNIHINITTSDGRSHRTTYNKEYNFTRTECFITRSLRADYRAEDKKIRYLLFSKKQRRLPAHEERKHRTKATIELAFPIDPTTQQPKLSQLGQYAFAFLPLQRLPQVQVSNSCLSPGCPVDDVAVSNPIRFHHLCEPRDCDRLQVERGALQRSCAALRYCRCQVLRNLWSPFKVFMA